MALILPGQKTITISKLKLPGSRESLPTQFTPTASIIDPSFFKKQTTTPQILGEDDFQTKDLFKIGKNIVLSIPKLADKGTEFRGAVLRAASAIETSIGQTTEKIAQREGFVKRPEIVKNVFKTISNKLNTLAKGDLELSKVGIEIKDPVKFSKAIKDPKVGPDFIASGIVSNAPNLLLSIGAGIVGTAVAGPVGGASAAFGVSAALEGGFAFQDAKEFGLSDEEATIIMTKVGIANGLLEMFPVSKFLNRTFVGKTIKTRILKQITKDIVLQSLEEAGTEGLQEIVSNAVARSYDENRSLLQGVSESVFFGGLLGFGTGVGGGFISTIPKIQERATEIPEKEAGFLKLPGTPEKIPPTSTLKGVDNLTQQAKKFKSAEEFVKAQPKVFHGTTKQSANLIDKGGFKVGGKTNLNKDFIGIDKELLGDVVWFTDTPQRAKVFAGQSGRLKFGEDAGIVEVSIKNLKMAKPSDAISGTLQAENAKAFKVKIDDLKARGFDGLQRGRGENIVWNIDQIKTKSQLTDIYNQAVGKAERKGIRKPPSVKKVLGIEPAPFIKKRETTLLKERIKAISKGVREGTIATKKQIKESQTILLEVIEQTNLDPKDRDKFRRAVKNVQTREQLIKVMPEIQDRIRELETKAERRTLKAKIKKEIKATRPKKQTGKPVGKFTPEIQRILDIFRNTINLKKSESEIRIQNNLKEYESTTMPPEVALENKIITLLQGSPAQLQTLLEKIVEMKTTGNILSSLKAFNIQEDISAKRNLVINHASGFGGLPIGTQTTGKIKKTTSQKIKSSLKSLGDKWIMSWEGLLKIVDFNAGVENQALAKTFTVGKQELKFKELQNNYIDKFNAMISSVYNIKNKPHKISKKIIDLNQEINLGTFKNSVGQKVEIKMTTDEMIKRWQEFQDPTLEESFLEGNNYTNEIKNAIVSELSDQDISLGKAEMALYKEQRDRMNKIFADINGINLPFNQFYTPIRREGFVLSTEKGIGEFIEEVTYRRAVTTSSLKSRVKTILPLAKQGSLEVIDKHFHETNYYISWAKKIRELDMVFKDKHVRTIIRDQYSSSTMSAIDNSINDLSTNGNKFARRYRPVDFFRKNFTVGALMIKPALSAKQFVSTLAYLEKLSSKDFALGVFDFWKHPVKNTRTLNKESIFINSRGKLGDMERDIKAAVNSEVGKRYGTRQNFINTLMMNVRVGDKGAILTGSWAIRHARLKKGIELKDAIDEYEKFSSETQQSADLSQLSEVQRGGSLEQLFTMFKSSQRQYYAKEVHAIKSLFQKGGTSVKNIKKVAKIMAIYHVLLPVAFQWIANFGGWDEEDKKEYIRAGLLGSINGLFIFGDIVDSILRTALGLRVWDLEIPIVTISDDVNRAIKKLDFDDIEIEDVWEALGEFIEVGNSLGAPVEQTKNIIGGVQNLMEGDIRKGSGLILGWSEFSLKQATDEETFKSRGGVREEKKERKENRIGVRDKKTGVR